MKLSPVLAGHAHVPVRAADRGASAAARRAGVDVIDFGIGEPREETPAFIREALAAALEADCRAYPLADRAAGAARRDRRLGARRFGVDARPGTRGLPTLGSKEAIFRLAQIARRRAASPCAHARLPRLRARRRVRRREVRRAAAARRERGFLPDLDAVDAVWARVGAAVAELPEQPDRRATAPLVALRARRGARPRARLRAGLRRGLLRDLLRREPPARRSSSPTARNVAGRSTRSPSARRCRATARASSPATRSSIAALQALPPERRHRRRRSSSSGRPRRRGATRRTSSACARSTAPSATRSCPRCEAAGLRHAGGDATFFLWLARARRERRSRRGCSSAASSLRPGSFLGPAGEGFLRLALVPTLAECERAARLLEELLVERDPELRNPASS